jgi:hypothetical protein
LVIFTIVTSLGTSLRIWPYTYYTSINASQLDLHQILNLQCDIISSKLRKFQKTSKNVTFMLRTLRLRDAKLLKSFSVLRISNTKILTPERALYNVWEWSYRADTHTYTHTHIHTHIQTHGHKFFFSFIVFRDLQNVEKSHKMWG